MGNQSSSGQESPVTSHSTAESLEAARARECERLTRKTYQAIAGETPGSDITSISCDQFKTYIGDSLGEYAGLLAAVMSEPESGQISEEKFVSTGSELIQEQGQQEQLDFYFKVFSHGRDAMDNNELSTFLECCARASFHSGAISYYQEGFTKSLPTITKSMLGTEATLSRSDLSYWCSRHCVRLVVPLHKLTQEIFTGKYQKHQSTPAGQGDEASNNIMAGSSLVSLPVCWMLCSSLPVSFLPATSVSDCLQSVIQHRVWSCLYDSNQDGLSINRWQHHVISYKGPTLMLLQFEGYVYCLVVDEAWKDSTRKWGGSDCCLIQLYPQYRTMQAGPSMVYMNTEDRTAPKGLFIGKDSKTMMLEIDAGLSKVKHYGIDYPIHRLEVWACGDPALLEEQKKQKAWERRDVEKQKERKLKLEDWKDNPDRQLLEMGGVQTEHAER